ncbi:AraC family transcriptional regulator [Burkholderia lata]|uniref:AraC family transcriptional regulator n=1 Tax=Burkholderia lata (strain ATCC 17760 / DSM 23089 / LMG 22485 / NCIMB 9086 / R18194 / 383) TaxID=482957 RepID=A0A6P3AQW0_BURL3|nr:AraC family transcriptional regulator [Burkholderia lata]
MKIVNALTANLVESRFLEGWTGISPRTTYRRFVTELGLTFAQRRQQTVLLRALERIVDGAPVTTIGLDLGYDNARAFIDMFRRALGATPGRYAETGRPGEE